MIVGSDLSSVVTDSEFLVIGVRADDGVVEHVSPAVLRLTRREAHEVLGQPWWDVLVPERLRADVAAASARAELAAHAVTPLVTVEGYERLVVWAVAETPFPGGDRWVLLIGLDVSSHQSSSGVMGQV